MVRAIPGPVFSIASFMGGIALKKEGPSVQLLGCIIGSVAIFLPSALLVLFFFPVWQNLKKFVVVLRSLEGINAAVVGIMMAATFYLLKDVSIMSFNTISLYKHCCYYRYLPGFTIYQNTAPAYSFILSC